MRQIYPILIIQILTIFFKPPHQRQPLQLLYHKINKIFMTDQIEKEITINELATIVINGFENVNKKFGNMDRQFENVDKRFGSIDKQFENVDKRFGNMDRQFGNIDKEFKSVHQEIENLAISTANGFMEVHKEI